MSWPDAIILGLLFVAGAVMTLMFAREFLSLVKTDRPAAIFWVVALYIAELLVGLGVDWVCQRLGLAFWQSLVCVAVAGMGVAHCFLVWAPRSTRRHSS